MSTPQTGQFQAPSSVLSSDSSFDSAREVEALLSIVSPHHTQTHMPEGCFQSLTTNDRTMSTPMEIGEMPGGMEDSSSKGKVKGDPAGYFSLIMSGPGTNMTGQRGGGSAPPPAPGPGVNTGGSIVITPQNSKKTHQEAGRLH